MLSDQRQTGEEAMQSKNIIAWWLQWLACGHKRSTDALKRGGSGHAPRSFLTPGGTKENQKHLKSARSGVLVRHGGKSPRTGRTGIARGGDVQEELQRPMGALGGYISTQERVYWIGLGNTRTRA